MTSPVVPDQARTAPSPAQGETAAASAGDWEMGWYHDPWQRHQRRFYDGDQWTEHVADGGISGLDTEPVSRLPRSRPRPRQGTPPEGSGPRVLAVGSDAPASLDAPLLLLDDRAGPTGRRELLGIDDGTAGRIDVSRPAWPRRLVRLLVTSPSTTTTALVVRDHEGRERLRVRRPWRRIAPVVDVVGPQGPIGRIEASAVRQGLRATVATAGGDAVGVLEQTGATSASRRVVAADGAVLARLTAVWDVPGPRIHLPPGVLLLDRSAPAGAAGPAPHGDLLLGALLGADLLAPPPAPGDR